MTRRAQIDQMKERMEGDPAHGEPTPSAFDIETTDFDERPPHFGANALQGSLDIQSGSVEQPTAEAPPMQSDTLAPQWADRRLAAEAEIEWFPEQIEWERAASHAQLKQPEEEHRSAISALENQLKTFLARVDVLMSTLERQRHDAGVRDAASPGNEPPHTDLQAHVRRVEQEFSKATVALAEAERYAHHVESELARQRVRGDEQGALIAALLASRSWEVTEPFRRLGAASPTARRWLRRLSRALPLVRAPSTPHTNSAKDVAEVKIPGAPDAPSARATEGTDKKKALTQALSANLDAFLGSDRRLMFPKVDAPVVSVIVVLWNKAHFTLRCLQAIQAQDGPSIELIIVDNASMDNTGDLLDRIDGATIIRNDENVGFLLANNQAGRAATGKNLLLLNNDAFPRPGAISAAVAALHSEPGIGAVGGLLVLPSGLAQEGGSIVWNDGSTLGYGRGLPRDSGELMFRHVVSYCSGAFLLTPRNVWNDLGGFDEKLAPAYYEDTDYCFRLRELGLKVIYEPSVVVDHYELGSEAKSGDATEATLRNRVYFRDRHSSTLAALLPPNLDNPLAARDQDAGRSRRLLIIDDLLPLQRNGSGTPRARAIIAAAVKAGWSVTCYVMRDPNVDWASVWAELPPGVEIIADGGESQLGNFLQARSRHYHAILVSRPHNMPLFWTAVGSHPGVLGLAHVVYDAEAIFAERQIELRSFDGAALDKLAADALIEEEIQASAAGARAVTCVTEKDRLRFRRFLPPTVPVHRLSHAVDLAQGTPPHSERRGFLFVGRLFEREAPNWQGLAWFVREAWPLIQRAMPDAELTVVGKLHPAHQELAAPGVRLLGQLTDLQATYDRARVFVAPVRLAAGVPIKIIEATAAGLPTVCTTLMARQLGWPLGEALAGADDPIALARFAVALHDDADFWHSMVDRARALVVRDYGRDGFEAGLQAALEGRH